MCLSALYQQSSIVTAITCINRSDMLFSLLLALYLGARKALDCMPTGDVGREDATPQNIFPFLPCELSSSCWPDQDVRDSSTSKNKPRGASECVCAHICVCAFFLNLNSHPASVSGCVCVYVCVRLPLSSFFGRR